MTSRLIQTGRRSAVLLFTFLSIFLVTNPKPALSFGKGPYTHYEITRQALERYTAESGNDIYFYCQNIIIEMSLINDSKQYANLDRFHCDNSNFAGCAFELEKLKHEAVTSVVREDALNRMGIALHIVQDFYAHSNWVEKFGFSGVLAPIEAFQFGVPPEFELQSGTYPDLISPVELAYDCYFVDESEWDKIIPGATHDCLNKDSSETKRGASLVRGTLVNYHTLAGEYAIEHSKNLIAYFAQRSAMFQTCLLPEKLTHGCNRKLILNR